MLPDLANFPACPQNHGAVYYCCELSATTREVFTRFTLPSGDSSFDRAYRDGWAQPRQVNYPYVSFTPDTPVMFYDQPESLCRLQSVITNFTTGERVDQLQCATQNQSLALEAQDATQFWTHPTNARNNNASFPIGAICTSLMDATTGRVSIARKEACVSEAISIQARFTSFMEPTLVLVYLYYLTSVVLVFLWSLYKRDREKNRLSRRPTKPGSMLYHKLLDPAALSSSSSVALPLEAVTLQGLAPSSAPLANIELDTRASAHHPQAPSPDPPGEAVVQTGYSPSRFGRAVLLYLLSATAALNILLILLIRDYYGSFSPPLFQPNGALVLVFFLTWLLTSAWYVVLVVCQRDVRNFFRLRTPLHSCSYVHMLKPDHTELLLADHTGISECVARVEKSVRMLWTRLGALRHTSAAVRCEEMASASAAGVDGFQRTLEVALTHHCDDEDDGQASGSSSSSGNAPTRVVEFQHLRYVYDASVDQFVPGHVEIGKTYRELRNHGAHGLSTEQARQRRDLVGPNEIRVAVPPLSQSILHELFSLFYVYQLMCYYVWYYFSYWTVALVMTGVVMGSASIKIYTKRAMQHAVAAMTHDDSDVDVYRDGSWHTLPATELVPGDLVHVREPWRLPCDLVLLRGATVCDEAMLTGEAMPVQKLPLPDSPLDLDTVYDREDSAHGAKHTLFAGTQVLASGRGERICALVVATGAHTSKGQLVQAILFPPVLKFKYDQHLKVVIAGLLLYGCMACVLGVRFLTGNGNLTNKMAAFCYCIFLLSGVVSPLLPVVITVGQVNAAKRLEQAGIFSLNIQRITLAGKVRVFCFDKTGTLTKQGLDMLGCQPVSSTATSKGASSLPPSFLPLVPTADITQAAITSSSAHSSLPTLMQYAMASCHSVGLLHGEPVGNEVELRMFAATNWRLIETEGQRPRVCRRASATEEGEEHGEELEFLQRFDFDHSRMSMSVVVRHRRSGRAYVFCKGSYERMKQLCSSGSLPADYDATAQALAKNGCYVLGIAVRELPLEWSLADVEALATSGDRDAVESELSMLGLLLFRNELKPDTAHAIAQLQDGDTRVVMITGDNALCGCYIARASGMISEHSRVILGDVVRDRAMNASSTTALVVEWRDLEDGLVFSTAEVTRMVESAEEIELAVTGAAFDALLACDALQPLLLAVRIYSRMTPDGKIQCVQLHMATGAVTGMCGDGGNDCGALRIAHVGVALSDAEASVVSPFASKPKSVASVVDLCREGRCSLATSFASVKMLIVYGIVGSIMRLFEYYHGVILSEWCFILMDGPTLVGLSYVITLARPLPTLGQQRPTSSLIGVTTVVSTLGQVLVNFIFLCLAIAMLKNQPWYCPFTPDNVDLAKWWLLSDNPFATCLFFLTIVQQQAAAIAFSFGSRFRAPIWQNWALVAFAGMLFVLDAYLVLGTPSRLTDLFRIASGTNVVGLPDIPLPYAFRVQLVGLLIANVLCVLLFEFVVVLGPVRDRLRFHYHKDRLPPMRR